MTRRRRASAPADRKPGPVLPADSVRKALFAALPGVLRQLAADPWIARRLPDPAFQAVLRQGLSEFIRWAPTLAAVGAYRDMMEGGDPARLKLFLQSYLGLPADAESRPAFFDVCRRARWQQMDRPPDEELVYLRGAIRQHALRLQGAREKADRVWWPAADEGCEAPQHIEDVGAEFADSAAGADAMEHAVEMTERVRIISRILDDLEAKGLSPQQRVIANEWRAGRSGAGAIQEGRATWAAYQSLQRRVWQCLPRDLAELVGVKRRRCRRPAG